MAVIYSMGTKLYNYVDDELVMVRVKKYDEKTNSYEIYDIKDHITLTMGHDDVHNYFIKLKPDGLVTFYIVRNSDEIQDVLVTLHPYDDKGKISIVPYAACRQDCVDIFKMADTATPKAGQIWAGCSISTRTCPAETSIVAFINCQEFKYSQSVAVYCDDTIEDILQFVFVNKFNGILETYEKKHRGDNLIGICTSLKELLEDKDFMMDFHDAFDIVEVPFPIIGKDTDELLKQVVEQVKSVAVKQVYTIPYDKTIDLTELQRPYIICTPQYKFAKPEDRKLYLIGYDVDDEVDLLYKKYGTNNREELIEKLGFKEL